MSLERRLMEDAREWQRLNRDDGALLAGARLIEAEAWLASAQRDVAPFVREFIQASVAQEQRELEEREAQRKAQLKAAESKAVAERKAARHLKAIVAVVIMAAVSLAYLLYRSNADRRAAQEQLARSYWEESRVAREGNRLLESLHWIAEALSLKPPRALAESMLLDVREVTPQTSLSGILQDEGPVEAAVFNRAESRILTWSQDKSARLWDTATGKPIGPALQHEDPVVGAVFNRDESRILTWSRDKTARLWDMGVDLDFTIEELKIELMAMTGTEFNPVIGQLNTIDPERWRAIRREYIELASQHLKVCRFPAANQWRRFNSKTSQ